MAHGYAVSGGRLGASVWAGDGTPVRWHSRIRLARGTLESAGGMGVCGPDGLRSLTRPAGWDRSVSVPGGDDGPPSRESLPGPPRGVHRAGWGWLPDSRAAGGCAWPSPIPQTGYRPDLQTGNTA